MNRSSPLRGLAPKSAKVAAAALCLAILTAPAATFAANAPGATVGAIRWDAWVGDLPTGAGGHVGLEVERNLGLNQFHDRVPFYGVETGTDSVNVRQLTQVQMDADIAYAKRAGLNYWAFCYFPDNDGMSTARNLYQSSTQRENLNYTYVVSMSSVPAATLASEFSLGHFQKVLNGRPLLYVMINSGDTTADMATYVAGVRSAAATVGAANPYIVLLSPYAATASSYATAAGADAISTYADGAINGVAYSTLISQNASTWNTFKNTGKKVVPSVTTGWDNRPRSLYPQSWWGGASAPANAWVQKATPAEIGTNLQNAVNWVQTNQTTADANTVLMYAWNEFDEGGWMTPTLQSGTDRVDAVSEVLKYSSTSNWPGQTAHGAFDGDPNTNWQAGPGTSYAGQWLEVDFGRDAIFSQATISEYGTRTTGYRIEYLNGSTWKTAYTGTGIGASSTVTFPAVTGRKARIYFTSGTDTAIIYAMALNATPVNATNLGLNRSYASSTNWDATQTADKAFDGDPNTNWQGRGATVANTWLEADFGVRKAFNTVTMTEFGDRTGGYRIEYWTGTAWATAYTGTTIGTSSTVTFPTVIGSKVRLYFTAGSLAPIIYEMTVSLN
ncbi:hypothetical protein ASD79_12725 [Caulobacter sp. Root655]|uniref:discoidin domain-containing protein n=1 Tax=Caulobacter sp. Root655 TaxID=1736578 RepID=UPI0006F5EB4E|nr:discoidin domain-containing protein [Caulobacter sp. Root655]KRA59518.1 hypothetical protein ASD79_12725 [Caulobacter sp. Root655]